MKAALKRFLVSLIYIWGGLLGPYGIGSFMVDYMGWVRTEGMYIEPYSHTMALWVIGVLPIGGIAFLVLYIVWLIYGND